VQANQVAEINLMEIPNSKIYELSICFKTNLQAHSMSNIGNKGTNRLFSRRQLLSDGTETDALSGNIFKHHHASLLSAYFEANEVPLCVACSNRNVLRSAAPGNSKNKKGSIKEILVNCGTCDTHGFLITTKNKAGENGEKREGFAKHSLIEFSMALADPANFAESHQLYTRTGEEQMIMTLPARSGGYAMCIRYTAAGVGVDTQTWHLVLHDPIKRKLRHKLILLALRDQLLSPVGATTSRQLPHLTELYGSIVCLERVGRAPIYSPLERDFQNKLEKLGSILGEQCTVYRFNDVNEFAEIMTNLANVTEPGYPFG
jgi:CRISPR-associated autoregulator DevR family